MTDKFVPPPHGGVPLPPGSELHPQRKCRGCGHPLMLADLWMMDGCPCNSARGVNFRPGPCQVCADSQCVIPAHRIADHFDACEADS